MAVAVDNSIRNLKVEPLATETATAATSSPPQIRAEVLPDDKPSWKLDYPMPGELALGRWRSAETKAVGAVATFPLPGP